MHILQASKDTDTVKALQVKIGKEYRYRMTLRGLYKTVADTE